MQPGQAADQTAVTPSEKDLLAELSRILHDVEAQRARDSHETLRRAIAPAVTRICVVGGGTAGFLTAIGIRQAFRESDIQVSLVEAPDISIIGVGEATVDTLPAFLHHGLGIDIVDFYERVRPTWKLGIRFDWGAPEAHHFAAPFGWGTRGIGLIGSLAAGQFTNQMNLHSMLMEANRVPIFRTAEGHRSALNRIRYAYHLDNKPFVRYLHGYATSVGVTYVSAHVAHAEVSDGPDGEPVVDYLRTRDGLSIEADLFVDCTGFRSSLLRERLGGRFLSFASSLFTDRALVFNAPHHGMIKPYTTAKTMNAGWAWIIPTEEDDHCGYVHSSSHIAEETARAEIAHVFPGASEPWLVSFRSGRTDRCWIGNVVAVGNSYGFVEPLESTGILMIQTHVEHIITALRSRLTAAMRQKVNESVAGRWDSLRWFLSIHFRFNGKRDTEYWRAARCETDISGLESAIDLYAAGAPLALRNSRDLYNIQASFPFFYGVPGLDCLLLGQGVPTQLLPSVQTDEEWLERRAIAQRLVAASVTHARALEALRRTPELLRHHAKNDFRYAL